MCVQRTMNNQRCNSFRLFTSDDEWRMTFDANIHAMFYLTKAAVPHMKPVGPGTRPRDTDLISKVTRWPASFLRARINERTSVGGGSVGSHLSDLERGFRAISEGPLRSRLISLG